MIPPESDRPDFEEAAAVLSARRMFPARLNEQLCASRLRRPSTKISSCCGWILSSRRNRSGRARYSWGDENQSNQGINLDGTKILTNFEQYMGSNTRTFSPNMVNEARFGYTRFFNSIGTFLAFQPDVVSQIGIPGSAGGHPCMGYSERHAC